MSKIKVSYENKTYTLEYTREVAKIMEKQGFVLEELQTKPATMVELLFRGAFIQNHRDISMKVLDNIITSIDNKAELLQELMTMYANTLKPLMDEPEKNEKNATWVAE